MRPGGTLINLQPPAGPMKVEVRHGDEVRPVGQAWDCDEKLEDMRSSLSVVRRLVDEGLFRLRDQKEWRFEMRLTRAEDWREFAEKPTRGAILADDALLQRALEEDDGCIALTEDDLAMVLDRV